MAHSLVVSKDDIVPFDRGTGIRTLACVGRWNSADCTVTTGVTEFPSGAGIPLHTHNVEETVLVLEGCARVEIDEQTYDLRTGDVTWVPPGTPHRFVNSGDAEMRIYWVYGGRNVTRTICATGETFEHLSDRDRGGARDA